LDGLHLGQMLEALAKLDFFTVAAWAQTVLIERHRWTVRLISKTRLGCKTRCL
jgi:hypothetical protein